MPLDDHIPSSPLPPSSSSSLDSEHFVTPSPPYDVSQIPSPPVGAPTFKHSPGVPETGPQRHLSSGLRKIWTDHFKSNPFGYAISKFRHEIPNEDCLVWLDAEVRYYL